MEENIETSPKKSWKSYLWVVVAAVVFAIILRTFLLSTFFVPSGSMLSTLKINDHILVSKVSLALDGIKRGDIVVFNRPPNDKDLAANVLVKRIVGLPGEVISAKDGSVFINGKKLLEPYLPHGVTTSNIPQTRIPKNEYFMMGDNRSNSYDSRFFGSVPKSFFIGQVILTYFPVTHLKVF